MKTKNGVILSGLHISMRLVKKHAAKIWNELGQECIITGGLEGDHSAGSFHPFGYALDLRTRYFTKKEAKKAARLLAEDLGDDYDVVLEDDHIHVEFDEN